MNDDERIWYELGIIIGKKEYKDKIKAKIEEWDKDIKWNNADDHYYAIKVLKSLLEKEKTNEYK